MSYQTPTLPQYHKIQKVGLPTHGVSYFISTIPNDKGWADADFELEWVRNEYETIGAWGALAAPEERVIRETVYEEGRIEELAARIDAITDVESEQADGSRVEVTFPEYVVDRLLALRTQSVAA